MPDRVSLIEQYDNRDVIAQIYRIIDIAEHGAIETVTATKEGSLVKLVFTMHDGTKHEITFESNGVKDVYAVQSGSTETVHVVLDDDTERTFAFDIAIAGVTTDTQQTITAPKTFTAPQTFSGGIVGTTMIDGDVQVSNGHSLSVAGDIDTAGDMQVAGNAEFLGNVEAGGMAIEESSGRTILSNSNGIIVDGQLTLDSMSVGDVTAGGMSIGMSEDGLTVLNNNNGVRIGQSVKVPTTSTGTRNDDAVNGTRLQNDLDNYAPMKRITTGQPCFGKDTYENGIKVPSTDYIWQSYPNANKWYEVFSVEKERYCNVRFVDSTGNYLNAMVYTAGVSPNINKIVGVGISQHLSIAVVYDVTTEKHKILIKTLRERNHTCLIETWTRYNVGTAVEVLNTDPLEVLPEGAIEVTI